MERDLRYQNKTWTMNRKTTDLAWAAGFIDGEGCLYIGKHQRGRYHVLSLSVTQIKLLPLRKLKRIFRVGAIVRHKRGKGERPNFRPAWRYECSSASLCALLKKIVPYLANKRREAQLAIQFQDNCIVRNQRISDTEYKKREKYYRKMRDLKK